MSERIVFPNERGYYVCLNVLRAITNAKKRMLPIGAIHLNPTEARTLERDEKLPDRLWGYPLFVDSTVSWGEVKLVERPEVPLRLEDLEAAFKKLAEFRNNLPAYVMHPDDYKEACKTADREGVPVAVILARIFGF